MTRTAETTINGQRYVVVQRETADDKRAKGYPRVAELMEERGRAASLIVRKPNGAIHWQIWEDARGRFSTPTRLG